MSNLFGMMWTGVSGMNAAQTGIAVTGNNIANMKTESYSRQTVELVTKKPHNYTNAGPIGTGVNVEAIRREYDYLLAGNVRYSKSAVDYYDTMSSTLKTTILYFNELESGAGLGDALKNYFNAWQDLSNSAPDNTSESLTKRSVLVEAADTLAKKIQDGYKYLESVRSDADKSIQAEVNSVNEITEQIALLNKEIVSNEALGKPANELRDLRDGLIDKLASKTQISTSMNPDGSVNVFMNGETLVDRDSNHLLYTEPDEKNEGHLKVMFRTKNQHDKGTDMTALMKNGTIAAHIKVRDNELKQYMSDLDSLAKTLVEHTNRIHASGVGLDKASEFTGKTQVMNPEYPLNSAEGELPYKIKDGSFTINVSIPNGKTNDKGEPEYEVKKLVIPVEADDNLNAILEKINSQGGNMVSASLNSDNTVSIKAASGNFIAFSDDTSDFLVAAGFNSFFSGSSAKDIAIDSQIKENPRLIAASVFGKEGDNTNALAMAKMQTTSFSTVKGNITINAFYGYYIQEMSTDKTQNDTFKASTSKTFNELNTQLMSIKGVSEEDEQINLAMYQRMYESNSRYINVIDEMLNILINGLGAAGR